MKKKVLKGEKRRTCLSTKTKEGIAGENGKVDEEW